jgi:peptidoglycan/LPS O-acetylase OafA/YrhL
MAARQCHLEDEMRTLGSALDDQKGFGQGFDFLRIVLATGIIAWHTAQLSGHLEMARASAFWLSEFLLVPMFFVLSGFLVAGSSTRLSPRSFLLNRAARIVPALAVDIVFAALLIGPLVTTLPLKDYFTSSGFLSYFFNLAGWMHYTLPGVFESNPSTEVNGALWTVPFEICCYVVLIGLMLSGAMKNARWVSLLTYAVLIAGIPLRVMATQLADGEPSALKMLAMDLFCNRSSFLLPSFLLGVLLYQKRYSIPFPKVVAPGLICAGILVSVFSSTEVVFGNPSSYAIALPLLAYLTVAVGLSPMPRIPGFGGGDYSYGLYLYHVPFLQLLIFFFPKTWSGEWWWTLFFVGYPVALAAAMFSWHVIEYPVLKLRKSFAIRHRPEDGPDSPLLPIVVPKAGSSVGRLV